MQREGGIYKILSIPKVYNFIQWLFYHSPTDSYFRELIGVTEEKKILDVGCGPGDNVLKFPNSEYVGIDISQKYIDNANNRFGKLGRFYCVSVDEIEKIDITKIDIVIIKAVLHHLSYEQISYMLALYVANTLRGLVIPIFSALFPKFTQLVASAENINLITLYHKSCQLMSVFVLPLTITIAIFAKEILALWLGDTMAIQNTHQILTLLIIGTALNALMIMPFALQLAYGWTKLAFYKNIVAIIFLVPLMVWMVQMYQGIGAAWVWIILNFGYFIFEIPIMHRRLLKGEMGKWYSRDVFLPILIVTTIGLIAHEILPVDSSKMIMLLGVLSTFALSFIASAWATGHLNIQFIQLLKANDPRKPGLAESIDSIEQSPK